LITTALLLPVCVVLAWLYRRALPGGGRWRWFDTALLVTVVTAALTWMARARSIAWEHAGPVFPEFVAAVGAYAIFVLGLAAGLTWRRVRARGKGGER